ncbi:MAG: enoyl-CoA hydratase/carnithine racemase [Candidatus Azotimanducaceae bacterium]|jgi:enoyl-CoA hydratase/carnithine racemase
MTPGKKGERQRNFPQGGYINPKWDKLWQSYDLELTRVYMTLFDLQKPVIAQIQDASLSGGSELAGFCDLRIVADDAKIGWPVGRNWSPGNLQYIPWLVGMTKAKYYTFTSESMSGLEAVQCQWASESVPEEELEARTEELALSSFRDQTRCEFCISTTTLPIPSPRTYFRSKTHPWSLDHNFPLSLQTS